MDLITNNRVRQQKAEELLSALESLRNDFIPGARFKEVFKLDGEKYVDWQLEVKWKGFSVYCQQEIVSVNTISNKKVESIQYYLSWGNDGDDFSASSHLTAAEQIVKVLMLANLEGYIRGLQDNEYAKSLL